MEHAEINKFKKILLSPDDTWEIYAMLFRTSESTSKDQAARH
jgi:hypothetical protein